MSARPQRRSLIGSYRYSVVIKPEDKEFSEQMKGVLDLYDGKHVTQTHNYSSFDQLATTIINFWEKMLGSEVNVHRFANWLAEYFSDVGVTNINFYQLIEIVRNLGKGVSLHSSGMKVREAKVVQEPLESASKRREMTTDVENLLSPATEIVKPSELFKKEEKVSPSVKTLPQVTVVEEEEPEAPPVNTLLKPSEVIEKRDTIFEVEASQPEAPKRISGDPVVTKPSPKKEKKVKPVDILKPTQYLQEQDTIDAVSDTIVKPSLLSQEKTIGSVRTETKIEKPVRQPTKRKKVVEQKLTPPKGRLLKPSDYLKDKEIIFEKVEHLRKPSELIRNDSNAFIHPVRKIDPELDKIPVPPGSEKKKIEGFASRGKPSVKTIASMPFEIELIDDRKETNFPYDLKIIDIAGVGEKITMLLKDGGIETIDQLAQSKPEELSKIRGIGITSAKKLIYGANALITRQ
ncbi:MAG: helix-hairpin-helix domain-containing protein [Candidatus Heimdallarchaeota archaeon]|nr:helix-hairpin-helix domain-containing protein [Candidatus Heimdallarchaeota archaeon]